MAEKLKIQSGTRLQAALDTAAGSEPSFDLVCTFYKALDESAFLISIPMRGGKPLALDEAQRLLLRFGSGTDARIVAGYADDVVQEGIRRYWKMRRVTELRQFVQRVDERYKIALHVLYKQDTWPVNADGEVIKDEGLTLDISNGGVALYLNRRFEVGEVCKLTLPRVGTSPDGRELEDLVGVICWEREAPKGSPFRMLCGLQLRFAATSEKEAYVRYVQNARKRSAL
jgi:hypothetical protein